MNKYLLFLLFTFLFFLREAKGQTFTGTGGTIPDNNVQQCFPLTVSGVGNLTNTNGLTQVCLTINHPYDGDLDIILRSPNGTLFTLSTDNGGFGANYTNTCFTATAATLITAGNAPFTGSFQPEGTFFSVNNGQSGDGVWQLCITDDQQLFPGTGTLVSWSLTFGTPPPNSPPPCLNNPAPNNACINATPICNLDGFCGSTSAAYTVDTWSQLTSGFCGSLENNSWLRFEASAAAISFNVWVFNSQAGRGIQIMVLGASCSGPLNTLYCNGQINTTGNTPLTVNVTGLVPGQEYFIMIDGYSGDVCDYVLNANYGFAVLKINPTTSTICSGGNVSLTATGGTTAYTWTPATGLNTSTGATVVAAPTTTTTYTVHSQTALFSCPDSATATVTVNPSPAAPVVTSPVNYCLNAAATPLTAAGTNLRWYTTATGGTGSTTAPTPSTAATGTTTWYVSQLGSNSCESPRSAISVVVHAPASQSVSAQICPGGNYPFGTQTLTTAGTYTHTFHTVDGCDSVVTLTLTVGSAIRVNISRTICQGESTNFNGTNYSAAGSYDFMTSSSGGCDSITTLTLTVNVPVTPSFTAIPALCAGDPAPVLPTISNNSITGAWSPATVSNMASGTYTFTPTAGQCATTATLPVTVNPKITPVFATVASICEGTTAPVLPTTSINGITGTWSPATVSNTATGNYTFTPDAGLCATTTAVTVVVEQRTVPAFQAIGPICEGTAAPVLPATSTNGVTGTWNPAVVSNTASNTYTFTPDAGECATTTTLNITVDPLITPAFDPIAPICAGAPAPMLPMTSINGVIGTWNPAAVSNTATGTYTFTPTAGQCARTQTLTVTVNPNVTPTFAAIAPICAGAAAPVLPTTSNNGITGTWNPATVSNTASGTYTFTPTAGLCATTTTLPVTVNPLVTATQAITICQAQLPYPWNGQNLPAAGNYTDVRPNVNGCDSTTTLTLTVNPTINTSQSVTVCETQLPYPWNGQPLTASGSYTHNGTNVVGCDSIATLILTVDTQVVPVFTAIPAICAGATAPVLPATSNNGISGTWNPAAVSNTASGTYTFTPTAGLCARTQTLTVTVNPNVTPTFTAIAPICAGTTAPLLPTTSNNGITGTWNPATVSNAVTGTYTFTPTAGLCATTTTLAVTVKPVSTATQAITICQAQLPYPWNGQNLPAAGTYTDVRPNVHGCDSTTTLTLTVNPTVYTTQSITVCATQLPYAWNGQSLTASGTYNHTQPNILGCDSIATLTFAVDTQVVPVFTAIAPICEGATAPALPATSNNGIAGTWSPATVSNTATGTYTFTPNAGQCATTATISITVNPLPVAPAVTSPVVYCQNETATALNATGNNLLWYTTPTGGTGTATAPTPSTTGAGSTTWYVSQSASGCEGPRAAIEVIVHPTPPLPVVNSPVHYCQDATALPLSASGSDLLWYTSSTGGTGTTTAPTPSTTTPGSTTWYVSQTLNGCEGPRAALTVNVTATPDAPAVKSPVAYCQDEEASPLSAEGSNLLWYTEASGGVGSSIAPTPSTAEAGSTSWYVSQSINGCEGPRTKIEVIIHPNPTVDPKQDIEGTRIYLNARATGEDLVYAWTPPDGLSCTGCDRPEASPDRSTVYTVTVTTAAGCSASDTVGVYLDCNKIFIPNTFSPNGDGNNERFYPMGLSLKRVKVFRIYNRWGELVFSRDDVPANDPQYGWDGKYQNKGVASDAFVYYLEVICVSGETIFRKGDVTIIR